MLRLTLRQCPMYRWTEQKTHMAKLNGCEVRINMLVVFRRRHSFFARFHLIATVLHALALRRPVGFTPDRTCSTLDIFA